MKDEPVAVKIYKVIFFMNEIYSVVGIAFGKDGVAGCRLLVAGNWQLVTGNCFNLFNSYLLIGLYFFQNRFSSIIPHYYYRIYLTCFTQTEVQPAIHC